MSATYRDGYRACSQTAITGFDATAKARAYADAFLRRTRQLFDDRNLPDYHSVAAHVIGAETLWGDNAGSAADSAREVVLQIEARHRHREALDIFSKETTGVGLAMSTGRCAVGEAGRPRVTPVIAQYAFLIDKADVNIEIRLNGTRLPGELPAANHYSELPTTPVAASAPTPAAAPGSTTLPLLALAVARSGDKGNNANIGVMARDRQCFEVIRRELTADRVAQWFRHVTLGAVQRFEAPGFGAVNFVLHESLGGGGTSSLHLDKQAKTYAQILLAIPVSVPESLARQLAAQSGAELHEPA